MISKDHVIFRLNQKIIQTLEQIQIKLKKLMISNTENIYESVNK